MRDEGNTRRTLVRPMTAGAVAKQVMKPFRKRVGGWQSSLARIRVELERAERGLAKGDAGQQFAFRLRETIAQDRLAFSYVVSGLPRDVATAPAVRDVEAAMNAVTAGLALLEGL